MRNAKGLEVKGSEVELTSRDTRKIL